MTQDEHGIPPAGPAQAPTGPPLRPWNAWRVLTCALKCLVTAGIALLFLAVPVRLLYENLANSAGAQESKGPSLTLSPPAGNNHYGTPESIYRRQGAYLCVALEFLGLDPTKSWATFGIQVDVTSQGKAMIKKFEQGQQHRGAKKAEHPAPRFRNISLVLKSRNGLASLVIPIHSSTLAGKHSAHSRAVMGSAGCGSGYGENACAGGRQGLPSMRSCRTSMAFLPCLRAVSM